MTERRIGIRELKSKLSECVREVREGRTIVVTERGRAVARLVEAVPRRARRLIGECARERHLRRAAFGYNRAQQSDRSEHPKRRGARSLDQKSLSVYVPQNAGGPKPHQALW